MKGLGAVPGTALGFWASLYWCVFPTLTHDLSSFSKPCLVLSIGVWSPVHDLMLGTHVLKVLYML